MFTRRLWGIIAGFFQMIFIGSVYESHNCSHYTIPLKKRRKGRKGTERKGKKTFLSLPPGMLYLANISIIHLHKVIQHT